jgi:hypothetical protein
MLRKKRISTCGLTRRLCYVLSSVTDITLNHVHVKWHTVSIIKFSWLWQFLHSYQSFCTEKQILPFIIMQGKVTLGTTSTFYNARYFSTCLQTIQFIYCYCTKSDRNQHTDLMCKRVLSQAKRNIFSCRKIWHYFSICARYGLCLLTCFASIYAYTWHAHPFRGLPKYVFLSGL